MAQPPPNAIRMRRDRPLDLNPYSPQQQSRWHAAYAQCLHKEQNSTNDDVGRMYARLLGYLMLESPGDKSRDYITDEIIHCNGDVDRMNRLAKLYQDSLLCLFRQHKGHTPTLTSSYYPAGRPSAEEERYTQAKKAALRRDGFRCMLTGAIDSYYIKSLSPADEAALPVEATILVLPTNACHIFPPSTNMDLKQEEGHAKTRYAATVWSIVRNFGGVWIENELNGNQVHRLSNIMTMAPEVHNLFDELRLWFEEVPNTSATYTLGSTRQGYINNLPLEVTFTTTDPTLALPDKRYLKLHAAVCRVAFMSGATRHMDSCDAENEERTRLWLAMPLRRNF